MLRAPSGLGCDGSCEQWRAHESVGADKEDRAELLEPACRPESASSLRRGCQRQRGAAPAPMPSTDGLRRAHVPRRQPVISTVIARWDVLMHRHGAGRHDIRSSTDDLDAKERQPAPALQVPVWYLLIVLAAILFVCAVHAFIQSLKTLPPDHVVRLNPIGAADGSQLRHLLSVAHRVQPQLGVVTLTQGGRSLSTWLRHHHRHCGIRRFYLQLEPPADPSVLQQAPWPELVQVVPIGQRSRLVVRDYEQQMHRQESLIAEAMVRGVKDGLSHLLAIDDDELLFCPAGCAALHAALAEAPEPSLVLDNLEALAPAADTPVAGTGGRRSFFGRSVVFRHNTSLYVGYRHGKAVGALRRNLRPAGCCRFAFRHALDALADVRLPSCVAVLLHFESPSFASWRAKFVPMAVAHPQHDPPGIATLPSYYTLSLHAARAIAAAPNGSAASAAATRTARRLWATWKRAPDGLPTPPLERGAVHELLDHGLTVMRPLRGQPFAGASASHVSSRSTTDFPRPVLGT